MNETYGHLSEHGLGDDKNCDLQPYEEMRSFKTLCWMDGKNLNWVESEPVSIQDYEIPYIDTDCQTGHDYCQYALKPFGYAKRGDQ